MKKDNIKYDLHIHSVLSDGTCTFKEIIDQSAELGLKGISITDHDSIYPDMGAVRNYAASRDLLFINGIEFSTQTSNVHILGYNLDLGRNELVEFLDIEQKKRKEAIQEMCVRARKNNINISYEEVVADADDTSFALGRPHVALTMQKKGYVKNLYEAFHRWLKKGQPVYADYVKHDHTEVIGKILDWGGVPVLAHLSLISADIQEKIFNESLEAGLKGLEVYYPRFNTYQTQKLHDMAKKYKLIITGGSDFHGINKPDIEIASAGLSEETFLKYRKVFGFKD